MAQIARIGDSVQANCSVHGSRTGTITVSVGSTPGDSDTKPIAKVTDTGTLTCGHTFVIVSGSSIGDILGHPIARVGDTINVTGGASGTGTITSGSPDSDCL